MALINKTAQPAATGLTLKPVCRAALRDFSSLFVIVFDL
jgi:hypothetical protein